MTVPAARELSGDLYDRESPSWGWPSRNGRPRRRPAGRPRSRKRSRKATGKWPSRRGWRGRAAATSSSSTSGTCRGRWSGAFLAVLDTAFNTLHDRLGEYPRDEIKVIFYSRVAFRDITQAPDWSGGAYDGKIRIPVGGLSTVEEATGLLTILIHEMTHAFLYRMAPLGLPLWFNEGLATTFQGWDTAKIRAWFAEHPPEGLATLADVDRDPAGPRRGRDRRLCRGAAYHRRSGGGARLRGGAPHHRRGGRGQPFVRSSTTRCDGSRRVSGPLAQESAVIHPRSTRRGLEIDGGSLILPVGPRHSSVPRFLIPDEQAGPRRCDSW